MDSSHVLHVGSTPCLATVDIVSITPAAAAVAVAVSVGPMDTIAEEPQDARRAEELPSIKSDLLVGRQRRAISHKQFNRLEACLAIVLGFVTVVLMAAMTVVVRGL